MFPTASNKYRQKIGFRLRILNTALTHRTVSKSSTREGDGGAGEVTLDFKWREESEDIFRLEFFDSEILGGRKIWQIFSWVVWQSEGARVCRPRNSVCFFVVTVVVVVVVFGPAGGGLIFSPLILFFWGGGGGGCWKPYGIFWISPQFHHPHNHLKSRVPATLLESSDYYKALYLYKFLPQNHYGKRR